MKKTFKTALSLLFALILVLSVGIGAYADGSCRILINDSEVTEAVDESTLRSGVKVNPESGYYISSFTINGVDVLGYCSVDRIANLYLSSDDIDAVINDLSLSAPFTLDASVSSFPSSVDVKKVLYGSTDTYTVNGSFDLSPDNSAKSDGLVFDHWKITYDNGVTCELEKDVDYFTPFMDCQLKAAYKNIYAITFKADTLSKQFNGSKKVSASAVVDSVMYGGSSFDASRVDLSGITFSLDGDQWPGTKGLIANTDSASVSVDGTELSSKKFVLKCSSGSFEIKPRDLTVKAVKVEKEYDGEVLYGDLKAVSGLLEGDKINFCRYTGATFLPGSKKYNATEFDSIVIKDAGDNDVTKIYNIIKDPTDATYNIKANSSLKFKFAAKDTSAPYTGKPVEGDFKVVSGDASLLKDLKIVPSFKYDGDEHTKVGKRDFVIESVAIFTSKDEDITAGYTLEYDNTAAELNITQQTATITVKEASKEYDGADLSASDCVVTGLLDGHSLDKTSIVYTGSVKIGTGESNIDKSSVHIYDKDSNDITNSYEIKIVPGKLTVTPLKFTITAKSLTKTYDGTPLKADNTFEALSTEDQAKLSALGWHLDAATSGSQTVIGESDVVFTKLDVLDSSNNKIDSKYYEANMKPGTLKVLSDPFKKTVTITIDSATKVYDGYPLEPDPAGYTISDNLPNGYSIFVVPETDYITAAGTLKVGVKEYEIYNNNVLITDESAVPFNIEIKSGTLTITKYPIKITAKSGSKAYDGKELIVNSCTITAANNQLANQWHEPTVTIEAQDDNGNKVQAIKVGKYNNVITKVVIKDGNKDVTANYDITTVNGTLTIRNGNGNPQTGDTSNISLWATILAVSAVAVICLVVVVIFRSKKKSDK